MCNLPCAEWLAMGNRQAGRGKGAQKPTAFSTFVEAEHVRSFVECDAIRFVGVGGRCWALKTSRGIRLLGCVRRIRGSLLGVSSTKGLAEIRLSDTIASLCQKCLVATVKIFIGLTIAPRPPLIKVKSRTVWRRRAGLPRRKSCGFRAPVARSPSDALRWSGPEPDGNRTF